MMVFQFCVNDVKKRYYYIIAYIINLRLLLSKSVLDFTTGFCEGKLLFLIYVSEKTKVNGRKYFEHTIVNQELLISAETRRCNININVHTFKWS